MTFLHSSIDCLSPSKWRAREMPKLVRETLGFAVLIQEGARNHALAESRSSNVASFIHPTTRETYERTHISRVRVAIVAAAEKLCAGEGHVNSVHRDVRALLISHPWLLSWLGLHRRHCACNARPAVWRQAFLFDRHLNGESS